MGDFDAYMDAASAVAGLTIAEDHRPGVARFLELAARMAETLDRVDLGDVLELAPVFAPPDLRSGR